MNLSEDFPNLHPVLYESKKSGLSIVRKHFISKVAAEKNDLKQPPLLKHYMVDKEIKEVIEHNKRWAAGIEEKPKFKFAYLMLPTACNQKCVGCFAGKDKKILPKELKGGFYSDEKLDEIIQFLKEHEVKSIVYGGGGELFTWKGAREYIDKITGLGIAIVIFTNGTLLSKEDVEYLSKKDVSLIISLRDTTEKDHNSVVGINGFRSTLKALEYSIEFGMHNDNRVAVEIPVIKNNTSRVLYNFIPAMRSIGVIPFPEQYIQIMTSKNEKRLGHDFTEAREFFNKASEIDKIHGYDSKPVFGQRMLAQPKCQRPLYSFAIYPSGDVMDCPSHSVKYGNIYQKPLKEIIYSDKYKAQVLNHTLCPCSVFYTKNDDFIPENLPKHLEVFK